MSTFSQTTIDAFVQCEIDTLTCTSCSEDFLSAANLVSAVTDIKNSVATVNDLPDLLTTPVSIGTRIYVQSIKTVVVATQNSWVGLDGRKLRIDYYLCRLYAWGDNQNGALGDGTTTSSGNPITPAGGGINWSKISGTCINSLAIKSDGTLWTWGGNNYYGTLGNSSQTCRSSPGTVAGGGTNWCLVSGGRNHSLGIKTNGTLWAWGQGCCGQLATGTTGFFALTRSPAQISGTWSSAAAGNYHSLAVRSDGTASAWGYNNCGQLGVGDTTLKSTVTTIVGGGSWCMMNGGRFHSAGIKTDGTLWTWGTNLVGELGTNDTVKRSSPGTTSGGGTNWCTVRSSTEHSMAIKTDGTLWGWGRGFEGQLGDGTSGFGIFRSSPVTVSGGGTTWCRVATKGGLNSTWGVKTDGTIWFWGISGFTCQTTPLKCEPSGISNNWTDICNFVNNGANGTILGLHSSS